MDNRLLLVNRINMTRQRPPAAVRRQLRKEANFGCVICGAPIIEYHHIVPYSEEEHNDPDRMVVLCRNHHAEAGPQAEAITPEQLYEYKEDPFNSDIVEYDFNFESNIPFIQFGGNFFQLKSNDQMTLLRIADQPLVGITFEDGILQFSARLFDENGSLIAELNQNEWWAETDSVWDLIYKGNHFKIWHQEREIGLEANYDSDQDLISMRGSFYAEGEHVEAYPTKTKFGGGGLVQGMTVVDCEIALWYTDVEGPWEVIVGADPRPFGKQLNQI